MPRTPKTFNQNTTPPINPSYLNELEVDLASVVNNVLDRLIGGTTGQAPIKNSGTNYDFSWASILTQAIADARYVNETDHTKAVHDAFGLEHGSLSNVNAVDPASTDTARNKHVSNNDLNTRPTQAQADALYVNEADHTKAAHDALALDHGALSGASDDDHTQYALTNGTRLRSYRGTTAPASPQAGQLWSDTSTTPPLLKEYNGTGWEELSGAGGGGGTSPPFADSSALVKDDADATKLIRVDAGTIATGNTRVLTMPNADVNLGALTDSNIASANKDGTAGTASLRTLGTGASQAAAGDDSRITGATPTTRSISTTAPLSGGGDLSANRTLSIAAATTGAAGSMSAADKTKLDAWGTNSYFWHAYQSSVQSDLSTSSTRLTFTTLENAAYNGGGNYSTATSLFTAPATGLYIVGGACLLTPGTAPTAGQFSQLIASINDADSYVIQRSFSAGTATSAIFTGGSLLIAVSATNTISLRLLHNLSGTAGTLPDTIATASTTYFWGLLLRTF